MSRRKKVTNITAQNVLLETLHEKVIADGPTGPLFKMLADKGIILADDLATGVTAMANNVSYLAAKKQSQILLRQRDILMKPLIAHTTDCFQFLKSNYSPNYKLVGDWGGTITDGGKITYVTDTVGQVALIVAIKTQNNSYTTPEVSPLAHFLTFQKIDLSDDATNGATAILRDKAYAIAKKSSEDFREKRDKDWPTVVSHINEIGDFAMKLFKGNVKILGAYGYTVINDPKVDQIRDIEISLGTSKLKIKAKIGSTLYNTGTDGIEIYKGKTTVGTPMLLAAGGKITSAKGYSTFSAKNLSTTKKGKFQIIPPKKAS